MCGLLSAAVPVIALSSFLSYNRAEPEEEVTALVSPKDGFPDSATAAVAIVVDGGGGQR